MPLQWLALLLLSSGLTAIWSSAGLPAALLLGPIIGGIVWGANGAQLNVPRWSYLGAQAVIGTMIGGVITPVMLTRFRQDWLLFCLAMSASFLCAAALGWIISRRGLIPGATAIYGTSPGAASTMVLLGEAHGADAQLIAFMQYSRVLLVALAAAVVARGSIDHAVVAPAVSWLAPVRWGNLVTVLLLAILGQIIARTLHLSAWALLGPMLLLSGLHAAGLIEITLPRWLLAPCYAVLGWHIGLGFRRDTLTQVSRALPMVLAAALALIGVCAGLSWCLSRLCHVDPLTAYLAMSPGGMDSVAVIAGSLPNVDMAFVMTLQGLRLLFVIALSPTLTQLVVRYSPHLHADRLAGDPLRKPG